jgi:hypothetical protein
MYLTSSSPKKVSQELVQNARGAGVYRSDSSERQQEPNEINPLLNTSLTVVATNSAAQLGASPFCTCHQSISGKTSCVCMASITGISRIQKRKEEKDESEDEPDAKKVKVAESAETDDGYEAEDESTYEPQPKRRKVLRYTVCAANIACDTDNEDDGDDDESFVGDEDTSSSEDDCSTMDEDNGSSLSAGTSSTFSPVLSTLRHAPSTNNTTPLHCAHTTHRRVRRCSITAIDMPRLGRESHSPHSLLSLEPQVKGRGRRKGASFAVYEDDTATPSGSVELGLRDDSRMPATNHRVLTALDQDQENRQPVYEHAVEPGFEMENVLGQEDGGEQMIAMESLVVSDDWP